jgi:hypothetical protein
MQMARLPPKIEVVSSNRRGDNDAIASTECHTLRIAYDFFNVELFDGSLPQVLVTLQRPGNSRGYFAPDRFSSRIEEIRTHELALNPDGFIDRINEQILSTLVHEQCHVWQQVHGKPSRRTYHIKEWAAKMKAAGLQPRSTGMVGGKETGQLMTRRSFCRSLQKSGRDRFQLNWQSTPIRYDNRKNPSKPSKMKSVCPRCEFIGRPKPIESSDEGFACKKCYRATGTLVVLKTVHSEDAETVAT